MSNTEHKHNLFCLQENSTGFLLSNILSKNVKALVPASQCLYFLVFLDLYDNKLNATEPDSSLLTLDTAVDKILYIYLLVEDLLTALHGLEYFPLGFGKFRWPFHLRFYLTFDRPDN